MSYEITRIIMMQKNWIAGHKIDWHRNEICIDGEVFSIEPKLCSVLKVLIDANDEIVSQQALLDKVWGDVYVANNTLQRCIAQLRKLLGDSAKKQQIIITHPKLGYSIAANAIGQPTREPLQVNPIQKLKHNVFRHNKLILTALCIILLSLGAFIVSALKPSVTTERNFSAVVPVSVESHQISSVIISDDESKVAYTVKDHQSLWSIIVEEPSNGRESKYPISGELIGKISFSSAHSILFSRTKISLNGKCSDVVEFNINTQSEKLLLSCIRNFNHSAIKVSHNKFIYEQVGKSGETSLALFDVTEGQSEQIATANISDWALDKTNKQLVYIAGGESNTRLVRMSLGHDFEVIDQKSTLVSGRYSFISFTVNGELILADQHQISWINNDQISATIWLHDAGKLKGLVAFENGDLLVLSGIQTQQVSVSNEDGVVNLIGPKHAYNHQAKFKPNSTAISFLSNQSGKVQLWNYQNGVKHRLTNLNADIDSYLWSDNGQRLIYLTNNGLWQTDFEADPVKITDDVSVSKLLQYTENNEILALAVGNDGTQEIIKFELDNNTQTRHHTTLLKGDQAWAKRLNDKLIFVEPNGDVFSLDLNSKVISAFVPYANFRIQKEPLVIDGNVYLQDKQFNIWRIPHSGSPSVYDNYTENSPFITDYQPDTKVKLAEQFPKEMSRLVLLKK